MIKSNPNLLQIVTLVLSVPKLLSPPVLSVPAFLPPPVLPVPALLSFHTFRKLILGTVNQRGEVETAY